MSANASAASSDQPTGKRQIPFGGFDYEDETSLAKKIELVLIQTEPDADPVPHPVSLTLEPGQHCISWNFEETTVDITAVTYKVLGPGDAVISSSPSFATKPDSGSFITTATGRTTISPVGKVVNTLRCTVQKPATVRTRYPPWQRPGIPFGGFDYVDETDGVVGKVIVVATTKPPGATEETVQDDVELPVRRGRARWAPRGLAHVIKLFFRTELVGGGSAGGQAEHAADTGMYVQSARGHTTGPVLSNAFTGWTVRRL